MQARHFKPVILASLLALGMAHGAEPNLVTNGSFEHDPVTMVRYFGGTELTGWKTDAYVEVRDASAGGAREANHFAELDAYRNGSMMQVLATEADRTYILRFRYSNRSGTPVESNGLRVTVGEHTFDAPVLPPNHSGDNLWAEHKFTFRASGPTVLTFTATGISDAVGSSLDDISVVAEAAPAPTHATAAAGLVGLMAAISSVAWRLLRQRRGGAHPAHLEAAARVTLLR